MHEEGPDMRVYSASGERLRIGAMGNSGGIPIRCCCNIRWLYKLSKDLDGHEGITVLNIGYQWYISQKIFMMDIIYWAIYCDIY